MKRLLITGARGFVGQHCIAPALASGFEVIALTSGDPPASEPGLIWRQANILATGVVERLVEEVQPTHVLHLAWVTKHGSYWNSSENLDWLCASVRLCSSFAAIGGIRFVSAGTCAEYDWSGNGLIVEGLTPERPNTFYGSSKLSFHDILMASSRQFGFSAATGRIFFLYGPNEFENRLVPSACRKLLAGEPAEFSSGTQIRDFLHVADTGSGLIALLNSSIEGACNVSSGIGVTISEVVEKIGYLTDSIKLVRLGALPDRPGDPASLIGSTKKLSDIGWVPKKALHQGLEEMVAHWAAKIVRRTA